jgi:hypothetical protein
MSYRPTREDYLTVSGQQSGMGLGKMGQGSGLVIAPCPPAKRCKVCRSRGQLAPGEKVSQEV